MSPSNTAQARNTAVARKPGFAADIIAELRKVVWPTRQETISLTVMVLVVAIIIGAFLGGLDSLYSFLVNHFIVK